MSYCRNCGNELKENAKFCQKCGHPVNGGNGSGRRKIEYVGKVLKCPNCGQELRSFETDCPACGLELREVKAVSSVRELSLKLEAIEAHREREKKPIISQRFVSKTDEQKVSLIKSFPIPNAKEDILEFMILATSNIDPNDYKNGDVPMNASSRALSDAWLSKSEQAYQKAKRSISNDDSLFIEIEDLYYDTKDIIKRTKRKYVASCLAMTIILLALIIVPVILLIFSENKSAPEKNQAEEERLTAIEVQIEGDLANGDYKLALLNAESMEYNGNDKEARRKWGVKKEYLIEKVIEEAAKDGVILERSDSAENDEEKSNSISGAFSSGFKKGLESNSDEIEQNIEEFKSIMSGSEASSGN
ncbi:MAG: zinc ribbon domain-containing protein [Acetatifactor sp.]|nr:zinc ribbon domain-containing protein [Acetatifactor sp.]